MHSRVRGAAGAGAPSRAVKKKAFQATIQMSKALTSTLSQHAMPYSVSISLGLMGG